ncbi:MAG: DUF58 domain-containing protein [Gemmatimonadaceae bacterium]|nr:DUF58 domain-containing protein [Gemmatimonadaceae bacterium]
MSSQDYGPLLDAIRGVRWPARRTVGAALPGAHRSHQRGTSGEFTEYRLYRQGDDPRQLDWRLLARSDRAFVRLTDDRAVLPTWFVVDASASMAFPDTRTPNVVSKWQMACRVAVGLGAVAHASGDPVGLIVNAPNGPLRLGARTRRGTVGEVARMLDLVGIRADGAAAATTTLAPLLNMIPARARVVLLTDLLGDADALVKLAAQRHVAGGLVECVHVVAREELDLPSGAFVARDPDDLVLERKLDRALHASYRTAFDAFRARASQQWRATGAGYTEVCTDAAPARIVRQIVGGRPSERALT